LQAFLDKNYTFCGFSDLDPSARHVLLRHDVDFSTSAALTIAQIEAELGISAHYFILLRTEFYNIFSRSDYENILKIQELGHNIGLHFDAAQYPDQLEQIDLAATKECDVLETILGSPVNSISFHRPAKSLHGLDQRLAGRLHAYQPRFFSEIAYFSDSQGEFRFGHPLDSKAFQKGSAMQLLTHPIWWSDEPTNDRVSLIDGFLLTRSELLRSEAAMNCLPFRKRLEDEILNDKTRQ
jgi:hypothetical protein